MPKNKSNVQLHFKHGKMYGLCQAAAREHKAIMSSGVNKYSKYICIYTRHTNGIVNTRTSSMHFLYIVRDAGMRVYRHQQQQYSPNTIRILYCLNYDRIWLTVYIIFISSCICPWHRRSNIVSLVPILMNISMFYRRHNCSSMLGGGLCRICRMSVWCPSVRVFFVVSKINGSIHISKMWISLDLLNHGPFVRCHASPSNNKMARDNQRKNLILNAIQAMLSKRKKKIY